MEYVPKFGRVLIEREIQEKIGSIYIPETEQKRQAPCIGKIIALGETAGWTECYDESNNLIPKKVFNIGDNVLFGQHAGTWVKGSSDEGSQLFLCQDVDILCVINKGE